MGAKLGQHFLTDRAALDAIVSAAGVRAGDEVLEIGPGRGALTGPLIEAGAIVTAVETDDALAASLPLVVKSPNLRVIAEDFLRFDLATLGGGPRLVVANLPYAVATPILQKVLAWDGWTRAALMFQKEVALRTVADRGADYGLLALSTRMRADAEIVLELPPEAFRPRPKVDSAVVLFRRLETPRVPPDEERAFWRVAKAAFGQRRKMAAGSIAATLGVPRAEVDAAFAAAGIRVDARPETIPFEGWAALGRALRTTPNV